MSCFLLSWLLCSVSFLGETPNRVNDIMDTVHARLVALQDRSYTMVLTTKRSLGDGGKLQESGRCVYQCHVYGTNGFRIERLDDKGVLQSLGLDPKDLGGFNHYGQAVAFYAGGTTGPMVLCYMYGPELEYRSESRYTGVIDAQSFLEEREPIAALFPGSPASGYFSVLKWRQVPGSRGVWPHWDIKSESGSELVMELHASDRDGSETLCLLTLDKGRGLYPVKAVHYYPKRDKGYSGPGVTVRVLEWSNTDKGVAYPSRVIQEENDSDTGKLHVVKEWQIVPGTFALSCIRDKAFYSDLPWHNRDKVMANVSSNVAKEDAAASRFDAIRLRKAATQPG